MEEFGTAGLERTLKGKSAAAQPPAVGMDDREQSLKGGRTTSGVVKIGDTVHRPAGANSPFVQRLLGHFESKGFAGAPRFRGSDSSGRDILTFIPGDVPAELGNFTDTQLESAARLLREFHDATTDCELRGERQIVCHGDASPCNCVFVNGIPAAFIDFDTAHAGERREDVGYAIWLWLDLGNSDLEPTFQARRLARFVEAYGGFALTDALPAVLDAQTELENRPGTPMGVRAWAQTCQGWVKRNRLVLAGIVNAGADSRG